MDYDDSVVLLLKFEVLVLDVVDLLFLHLAKLLGLLVHILQGLLVVRQVRLELLDDLTIRKGGRYSRLLVDLLLQLRVLLAAPVQAFLQVLLLACFLLHYSDLRFLLRHLDLRHLLNLLALFFLVLQLGR